MERSIKRYWPLFVVPTMAAFLIAFIIPFVMGVVLSFCDFPLITNVTFVGIDNYIKAFSDKIFGHAFIFTVLFAIVSMLIINVCAFALALALTRKLAGTNIFRTVFFMPNLIGGIVLGYIWQIIFNGILAQYQTALNLDATFGFWGLVILVAWQQIGYMMIIYIAGLQALPDDMLEAASIDGASKWTRLKDIIMPMMAPSFTICMFLSIANGFKLFDQNLALTAGDPGRMTEMLALNIYNTFYGRVGWEGVGQSKAVIFFVVVVGISLIQLYFMRKREVQA